MQSVDPSMLKGFQSVLGNAKHIVVLTGHVYSIRGANLPLLNYSTTDTCQVCTIAGAGTSAESGIPTFRGAGGLWREYEATALGIASSGYVLLAVRSTYMSVSKTCLLHSDPRSLC